VTFRQIHLLTGFGAGGSIFGALDHDALIAWAGAGVAIGGFLLSAGITWYHKIREATRNEDAADRARETESLREQVALQRDLTHRVAANTESVREQVALQLDLTHRVAVNTEKQAISERMLSELIERMTRERCPYVTDGAAKCASELP